MTTKTLKEVLAESTAKSGTLSKVPDDPDMEPSTPVIKGDTGTSDKDENEFLFSHDDFSEDSDELD